MNPEIVMQVLGVVDSC